MNAISFDTLKFARTLQAQGGFTAEQSTSLVEALGNVLTSDVATKSDLGDAVALLRSGLTQNTAELRGELKQNTAELRAELKQNTTELRAEMKQSVAELHAELKKNTAEVKQSIAEAKADTLKWVVGMIGFQTVAILGAALFLARMGH